MITRRNHGRGHSYIDSETGQKLPGVTKITGDGIPKKALIDWGVNTTVDYAIDHWARLSQLPLSARIKELRGARYAEKDKATGRGTHVHRLAERLIDGQRVPVPDEIKGHVESYVRFLNEWNAQAVEVEVALEGQLVTTQVSMVERTVYSPTHRYCGTLDLVADLDDPDDPDGPQQRWLIDLLTSRSGVFGEKALQVTGYLHADFWVGEDGAEYPMADLGIDRCGVLWLRPDGYDLVPIAADEAAFRSFLYAKEIADFVEHGRDLVGEPVPPPSTSMWRLYMADDEAAAAAAEQVPAEVGAPGRIGWAEPAVPGEEV